MPFDTEEIKRNAKIDYEKAWLDTRNLLKLKGLISFLKRERR